MIDRRDQSVFEGKVLEKLDNMKIELDKLADDVDTLKNTAAMGKGALWLLLKTGGIIAFFVGIYEVIVHTKGL